jgi:hypothetical protein
MRHTRHLVPHDLTDNNIHCELARPEPVISPPSFVKEFDDKLLRKCRPMLNVSLAVQYLISLLTDQSDDAGL